MPKSQEQFSIKNENEEKQKETLLTEKEKRALELVKEIKEIQSKPEEEKTKEDYQRIIELAKKIEKIFEPFKNGELITKYKGEWDRWKPHPEGVVIRKGNQFLLNGEKVLYESELDDWYDWQPHPEGVVIRKGNEWRIYTGEKSQSE